MTTDQGGAPGSGLGWRYFGTREIPAARRWAAEGGVAVHENIFKSRGRRTCHLLAIDEDHLIAAAASVGCSPCWIQRTRTLHFDLVEIHLTRALALCPNYPAERPEARTAR
jgi:hypothetical protein